MAADAELQHLRAAMDICNRRLAAVLQERARLARAIGRHKRALGLPGADPAREAAMASALSGHADAEGFAAPALQRIFAAVLAESRRLACGETGDG